MDKEGEAGRFPDLLQGDLHIVTVGIAAQKGESAADELLRQLMTLPRPVKVEFARTTASSPVAPAQARSGTGKSSSTSIAVKSR